MLKSLVGGIFEPGGRGLPDDPRLVACWKEGKLWEPVLRDAERNLQACVAWGAAGLLVTLVLAFLGQLLAAAVVLVSAGVASLIFFKRAEGREPAERVRSVGKLYWTGAFFPLEGKLVLYDLADCFERTDLVLHEPRDVQALRALEDRLRDLVDDLEVFESADEVAQRGERAVFGVDARLHQVLDELGQGLEDVVETRLQMPAVPAGDPLVPTLLGRLRTMESKDVGPVLVQNPGDPPHAVNARVEALHEAAEDDSHYDLDELLDHLVGGLEGLAGRLEQAFDETRDLLESTAVAAVFTAFAPSWSTYCAHCNEPDEEGRFDLQESSLLVYEAQPSAADGGAAGEGGDGLLGRGIAFRCRVCGARSWRGYDLVRLEAELLRPLYDQIKLSRSAEIHQIDRGIEAELDQLRKDRLIEAQKLDATQGQEQRKRVAALREAHSRAATLRAQILGTAEALVRYHKISEEQRDTFSRDALALEREARERTREAERRIREEFAERQRAADREQLEILRINRAEEQRKEERLHRQIEEIGRNTLMTDRQKEVLQRREGLWETTKGVFGLSEKQEVQREVRRGRESWE